jgi:hypothetical protein
MAPTSVPGRPVRACLIAALLGAAGAADAEFRDDFDGPLALDPDAANGWTYRTGDGQAAMTFTSAAGVATVAVDATTDRRGIWWAFIRREITPAIDLARLAQPGTELRVEARVRSSHGPRRINLHLNTQRTTDFHGNLMEFDLAEAGVWQTISMTTRDFDARPGDHVFAQLALMDWGPGRYHVEVDYLKVDVLDAATAGPDLGVGVPYRPPLADPRSFAEALPVAESATVDRLEPDANLQDWSAIGPAGATPVLTVGGSRNVVLRWDLRAFAGRTVRGSGLLELTTHGVLRPATRVPDFGMMRVVEILGGAPDWTRERVTFNSLCQGRKYEEVFNTQMIIDVEANDTPGGRTLITLSRPVLQRLIDGRTKGIILIPLGSISASFAPADQGNVEAAPKLRFNLEP